jgi:hypothetical protein
MKKLLRTRAPSRDADLLLVTDEGHETDIANMAEAYLVIGVLANKVRAFYRDAERRPCTHQLDEADIPD